MRCNGRLREHRRPPRCRLSLRESTPPEVKGAHQTSPEPAEPSALQALAPRLYEEIENAKGPGWGPGRAARPCTPRALAPLPGSASHRCPVAALRPDRDAVNNNRCQPTTTSLHGAQCFQEILLEKFSSPSRPRGSGPRGFAVTGLVSCFLPDAPKSDAMEHRAKTKNRASHREAPRSNDGAEPIRRRNIPASGPTSASRRIALAAVRARIGTESHRPTNKTGQRPRARAGRHAELACTLATACGQRRPGTVMACCDCRAGYSAG